MASTPDDIEVTYGIGPEDGQLPWWMSAAFTFATLVLEFIGGALIVAGFMFGWWFMGHMF